MQLFGVAGWERRMGKEVLRPPIKRYSFFLNTCYHTLEGLDPR